MALKTDRQKFAHVLRRFGLGSSEAELAYYLQGGLEAAIDRLIGYEAIDEGYSASPDLFVAKRGKVPAKALEAWWANRLIATQRPLQEKMTLFWHNHFATSMDKVKQPGVMWVQNNTFRANATGNFRTLLHAVSKDPAMIEWLDTQTDKKGDLNENFAREVMELFTLGIGNYSESDIRPGAKCYTGWAYRRDRTADQEMPYAEFLFRPALHDDSVKTFLGQTGNFDGDQALDILCDRRDTALFIVNKLWSMMAYEHPEQSVVDHLADTWRSENLEIKPLLKTIMTMPEFYSSKAERAIYKNPVDFSISTARQLGVGSLLTVEPNAAFAPPMMRLIGITSAAALKNQGMELFYPPNVSGWHQGHAWISSASLVARIGWGKQLFGRSSGGRGQLIFDTYGVFKGDPSVTGVVDKLVSVFDAPINDTKRRLLITAGQKAIGGGSEITEANANEAAAMVAQILFSDPDFQFC